MSMITEKIERLRTLADIAKDIADNSTDTVKTLREAADTIEQLAAKVRAENGGGWIPTEERLPECEKEVLVCAERKFRQGITKKIITSAFYEDGTQSEYDSIWCWQDVDFEQWDEENDCGIIPEGWWEFKHYNPDEVYNNVVDDHVVAWMPLPEPYREDGDTK